MLLSFKQTFKPLLVLATLWFFNVLSNIMAVVTFKSSNSDEIILLLLVGMKENSYVFNVLCHLIFTVILHVYFYMPITVFSTYCISMFSDNKNIICYQNVTDFNYFCDIYNEKSDLIKLFEKQVGILVFISFHV